jgi:hypothetical protein
MHTLKTTFSLLLLALLSLSASKLRAQLAPDFGVTDIQGEYHELYGHYLNEGHAVVLGFFYDGAPMLEDLFPSVQNYTNQAQLQGLPVHTLFLSPADSDASLITFAADHSIYLPVVSAEGGAEDAVAPYTTGDFGPFYGYPMFVVIGPDGTVVYDPWGTGVADTIAAIADAVDTVLNGTSVFEAKASDWQVVNSNGQISVDVTGASQPVQMQWFTLSGRLLREERLAPGVHQLPAPKQPLFLYRLFNEETQLSGKHLTQP